MPNSLVRAQELGFDGAVLETFTNEAGIFEFAVSEGELAWTLIPSDTNRGATTFLVETAKEMDSIELALNKGHLISGCISHNSGTVDFVPVEIRKENGSLIASTFSDDEGCFSVRVDVADN